jgi:anti-anti-sigma factor
MVRAFCAVQWTDRQAIVALPEHIDVSNAGQIREELLSVINGGAIELIADMTATRSCDHAGADAVARAYQRAVVSGTQLRLAVTAQIVRRVISVSGLERLVSVYPSVEAAAAAGAPPAVIPLRAGPAAMGTDGQAPQRCAASPGSRRHQAARLGDGPAGVITPAVVWKLVDALDDGVALAGGDGTLALANRRLEEMFGYEHAELAGRPVESLIPADLQAAHRGHRFAYARAPTARPMGAGKRLVGLRKDGATFPVEISLSPVQTATGYFILAVVRDVTEIRQLQDLADFARAAVAEEQAHRAGEMLNQITTSLFHVGLSMQAAANLPDDAARQSIADALQRLDGTIHELRDTASTIRAQLTPSHPA